MNPREWRSSSGHACSSFPGPGDAGTKPFSFLALVAPRLRPARYMGRPPTLYLKISAPGPPSYGIPREG